MYGRQTNNLHRSLIAFDAGITVLAFVATYYVRLWLATLIPHSGGIELQPITDVDSYQRILLALPFVWALTLYMNGTNDFRLTYAQMTGRYARAIALGLGLLITASFLFKLDQLARTFVVIFGVLNLGFLVIGRLALMETIAFLRRKHVDGHRMLVVGRGAEAVATANALQTQPPWNIKLLGFVSATSDDSCTRPQSGIHYPAPILGDIDKLADILDSRPVDEVLFSVPTDEPKLAAALNACDERGVDVLLPLPPALPAHSKVEVAHLAGVGAPLLGLRRTPTADVHLAVKRIIDLLGATLMLIVAAPVMAVVALTIKLTSRGPVLFEQVRASRSGRKFKMLKFRSMVADAEAKKDDLLHLNEMSGPVFKIRCDPRVTRIGAFIRATSLDELPQLFNILAGDMSLVGPRPPLPSEVDEYEPWQRRRLSVKPGLTGLWQVSGRNDIDFEEWMALDLSYIDNWSLWLDTKILMRTIPAVVLKSGAS